MVSALFSEFGEGRQVVRTLIFLSRSRYKCMRSSSKDYSQKELNEPASRAMSACWKTLAVPAGVPCRAVLIIAEARTSVSVLASATDNTRDVRFSGIVSRGGGKRTRWKGTCRQGKNCKR